MARLLLAEDDIELAELVRERLEREGFEVVHAGDGEAAVEAVRADPPDLLILDVMMPKLDGFGVCRAVRPVYSGPILMLTALDDDIDQVLGLELGADDYVVKPVKPRVLVARIRALLRRAAPAVRTDRIESGGVTIDSARREVSVSGESLELTTSEFDLLFYLAARAGDVVPREQIYRDVYGTEYDGLDRSADVYVSKLRAKLGDDPKRPRLLKTVRGVGYLFVPEAE